MTEVAQNSSSSAALDAKLEAFYTKRKAAASSQPVVAPTIQKAMNRERPVFPFVVENVNSGKSKDGEPYCTLEGVVQDVLANYTADVKIKNYYKTHVATVVMAEETLTLHTNFTQTFKPSLDFWATKGVEVEELSPITDNIVLKNGTRLSIKVDKLAIAAAETIEPFSVINVGLSCTAYCTSEEQAGKSGFTKPIKGTSLTAKQIELLEPANVPKVLDYIRAHKKCQVPVPTALTLKAVENYEHVVIADKKKQKVRSETKMFFPVNWDPREIFGSDKAMLVTLSTRADGEKSPFTYAEKEKQDAVHAKAEIFLTVEEVDPLSPEWSGAKHVVSFTLFESMLKFARIAHPTRWKEIAPTIFACMRMVIVGCVNLYTTFDNPRTKDNFRDNCWFDNYVDLIPQQVVIDYGAELVRFGIPVSRRWIEARLAAGAIKQGDNVNQIGASDKSVLCLTEWDSAAALEFLKRPTSTSYEFYVLTDTTPLDGHLVMYEKAREHMKQHPGSLGLEMLLWSQFSARNISTWLATMFTGELLVIHPEHLCHSQQVPFVIKSQVVYAVDVNEIAKRQVEAKNKPIGIQGAKPQLAITNGAEKRPNEGREAKDNDDDDDNNSSDESEGSKRRKTD